MTTNGELIHETAKTFRRSDSIAELVAALAKAQGMMEGAKKDAANPFFKSRYADLASVWDAVRTPLSTNGLAVVQFPRSTREGVEVETLLAHSSGEWMAETLTLPVGKYDPQGVGSAITYARRYGLQSITGVAPEDDDGNAAVNSQRYDGNNSVEANSLPRREQDAARIKNPPPPETQYLTTEQQAVIADLSKELHLVGKDWTDICKHYGVKRLSQMPTDRGVLLIRDLKRRLVTALLTAFEFTLENVSKEDPSVTADLPEELDDAQADAALTVLRKCKEMAAN